MEASAYHNLEERFRRILALRDAEAMLHWDLATMMPKGGAAARSDQLAVLKSVRHSLLTAPEMEALLDAASAEDDLDSWQRANVREMKRAWVHGAALTERQVEALSRAVSACEAKWREARADDDFQAVLPYLEGVLDVVRETAQAKAEKLGLSPYDALLDEYEPDSRSEEIDRLFNDLEVFLPDFLQEVVARQASMPAVSKPQGPFPIEAQRDLGIRLMAALGFDFHHGRLDVSLHPFCGGTPDDVRITTRYDEEDFLPALMGVLHETGHALYERGLPEAWRGQPVGEARGMAVHESQSLLIEMQVCRSPAFLEFAAPIMKETFGGKGSEWHAENLYRLYTRVHPGYIRVDADEVTYPVHVILRYRLEKAMISGDLHPGDIPEAWQDGMVRLLGLVPPTDRLGCLQDIHWYDGAWGYFPTYTLGAIAAAQLFEAATRVEPTIPASIAAGDFLPLVTWLRENVHSKGSLLTTRELMIAATGRPLDPSAFTAHLRRRYLA
jgi:carboxypeptidase Taq